MTELDYVKQHARLDRDRAADALAALRSLEADGNILWRMGKKPKSWSKSFAVLAYRKKHLWPRPSGRAQHIAPARTTAKEADTMPPNDNSPRNEADRQARGALAGAVEWFATNGIVLPTWADLNKRTAERIWKGQRDVPPGLARAIATEIRKEMTRCRDSEHPKLEGWAMALELWAEDCEHRAQGPG